MNRAEILSRKLGTPLAALNACFDLVTAAALEEHSGAATVSTLAGLLADIEALGRNQAPEFLQGVDPGDETGQ